MQRKALGADVEKHKALESNYLTLGTAQLSVGDDIKALEKQLGQWCNDIKREIVAEDLVTCWYTNVIATVKAHEQWGIFGWNPSERKQWVITFV